MHIYVGGCPDYSLRPCLPEFKFTVMDQTTVDRALSQMARWAVLLAVSVHLPASGTSQDIEGPPMAIEQPMAGACANCTGYPLDLVFMAEMTVIINVSTALVAPHPMPIPLRREHLPSLPHRTARRASLTFP